jgi:hypothetical protein
MLICCKNRYAVSKLITLQILQNQMSKIVSYQEIFQMQFVDLNVMHILYNLPISCRKSYFSFNKTGLILDKWKPKLNMSYSTNTNFSQIPVAGLGGYLYFLAIVGAHVQWIMEILLHLVLSTLCCVMDCRILWGVVRLLSAY